jgi:hypothetical protein
MFWGPVTTCDKAPIARAVFRLAVPRGLGSTAQRIYQTVGGGCDPEEDEQQRADSNQDFRRRGIGFLCIASFGDPISPTATSRNLDFVVGENARPRHGKGVVDVGHGDLRWKRDTRRKSFRAARRNVKKGKRPMTLWRRRLAGSRKWSPLSGRPGCSSCFLNLAAYSRETSAGHDFSVQSVGKEGGVPLCSSRDDLRTYAIRERVQSRSVLNYR